MPFFDMPLEELKAYRPPLTRQPDFDAFWGETLSQSAAIPVDPAFEPVDFPARALSIYDVRYVGWHRAEIAGRFLVPQEGGPFPALLSIHGYSWYHRPIWPLLAWAYQGYAVLAVDVRGQSGDSTDTTAYGGHTPGYMTQGILDPATYYYRGVYADAVRAIDVLASRQEVDIHRLGVTGISQGGGCSLAVAALDRRVTACMAEVPYLCHFRRAATLTGRRPYDEIGAYVKMHPEREETVFRTLSYCDNLNLADHITCPTLVTVGLMDEICPPSTIFAAYNYIVAPKKLLISTFGEHESFPNVPSALLRWADQHVRSAPE